MHDILPAQAVVWSRIESVVSQVFAAYACEEIRLPIVEETALFARSIGEVTDIIEKEMYTFPDRKEKLLSLRPEGTAGCVRAAIEHDLLQSPRKLWYQGPMFRYERPQKGRQRQFHQIGLEVFGYASIDIEVEILLLVATIWRQLELADTVKLEINSIGDAASRARYRDVLVDYFNQHRESLDEESQRRIESNPLRILDSKSPATQAVVADAPKLADYVSPESMSRFEKLCEHLESVGLPYVVNSLLVRGLDYYNDFVFEWTTQALGAQGTVCAGGRYDGLVSQLGGPDTAAVGFAMGVERLYLLLEAQASSISEADSLPDVFLMASDDAYQLRLLQVAEQLRAGMPGWRVLQHFNGGSLKSQFKKADRSGARYAVVLGEKEFADNALVVKDMRLGDQITVAENALVDALQSLASTG